MNAQLSLRVVIIFLSLALAGFDRHLAGYFPGDLTREITAEQSHSDGDLPVLASDTHEDPGMKTSCCGVPTPAERPVRNHAVLQFRFPRVSVQGIWQPPKRTS